MLWSELCGHSVSCPFWKQEKILIEYCDAEFASWVMLISILISLKILLLYSSYAEASQAFIKHKYIVKIPKQSIHKTAILGEYCVHTWSFCEKCFLWKHKAIKGNGERDEHNSHRVYGKIDMAFLVTYIAFFPPWQSLDPFVLKSLTDVMMFSLLYLLRFYGFQKFSLTSLYELAPKTHV